MPIIKQITQLPFYYRTVVETKHLDELNHMNVVYYLSFFEEGGWKFMTQMEIGMNYLEKEKKSIMALRHVISYHAEVRLGEDLAVYGRLLAVDHKRFHMIEYMVNETTNTMAGTLEILGIHADLVNRKSAPWKAKTLENLNNLLAEHQGLDWEAEVSGGIRL